MPSFSKPLELSIHEALRIANSFQHELSTLEHLLFALTSEPSAAEVMVAGGVDLRSLRAELNKFIDEELESLTTDAGSEATPTAGFQRVIQRAAIHIQNSGRVEVSGANVLIAIFAERESNAAFFLQEHGLTRYDAVNFVAHGVSKATTDLPIEKIIELLPEIEYPSVDELSDRARKFAAEAQARRAELEAEAKSKVTVSAVSANSGALAIQARSIELQIRDEIASASTKTPNFMSDAQQEAYARQIDFLEELAVMLGELATDIAKLGQEDASTPESLVDRITSLQEKLKDFAVKNRETAFWIGQMPAMLGFVALFSLAGANMVTATPLIMGLCGGDRIVKLVRSGLGKS